MSTVGIVLISHSRSLAEGAAELAAQMGVGEVAVRPAGGDGEGGLGTSIDLVEQAVREADGGAGVVLIADLGSSVLTARTYLEELEDARAGRPGDPETNVVLADAPFVEGAVAAASASAGGADVAAVVRAANEAYGFRKT
ncbi:dihydroxyacetone kinase phosphoryl donor subunit DhaM [Actinoallomurus spadix]|uniref:phosphoenolpyruvate--glycerone phosphotransferase n=1 Tax=Actinoallomurus spadix TaxID=79912 RepID=A0ABN0WBA7_9ACTN|nr:dihydroxyacetone kinase phosphoryl donor subunit DhaM [Actinoallomurus spadix]MCO5988535.1 dihydroxyacetone kinase phosphoryl donor subunit DhaM [Actinoallomurus spadix]